MALGTLKGLFKHPAAALVVSAATALMPAPSEAQVLANATTPNTTNLVDNDRYTVVEQDSENGFLAVKLTEPKDDIDAAKRPSEEVLRLGRGNKMIVLDYTDDSEASAQQRKYNMHILRGLAAKTITEIVYIEAPQEFYSDAMLAQLELSNQLGPEGTHLPFDFRPGDKTPAHNFNSKAGAPRTVFEGPYASVIYNNKYGMDIPYNRLYVDKDSDVAEHQQKYTEMLNILGFASIVADKHLKNKKQASNQDQDITLAQN